MKHNLLRGTSLVHLLFLQERKTLNHAIFVIDITNMVFMFLGLLCRHGWSAEGL